MEPIIIKPFDGNMSLMDQFGIDEARFDEILNEMAPKLEAITDKPSFSVLEFAAACAHIPKDAKEAYCIGYMIGVSAEQITQAYRNPLLALLNGASKISVSCGFPEGSEQPPVVPAVGEA